MVPLLSHNSQGWLLCSLPWSNGSHPFDPCCLDKERHLAQGDKSQYLLREDGTGAESLCPCCMDCKYVHVATMGKSLSPHQGGEEVRTDGWQRSRRMKTEVKETEEDPEKRNGGEIPGFPRFFQVLHRTRNLHRFPSIFPKVAQTP